MMPKHLQLLLTYMRGNSLPREVGHSRIKTYSLSAEPHQFTPAGTERFTFLNILSAISSEQSSFVHATLSVDDDDDDEFEGLPAEEDELSDDDDDDEDDEGKLTALLNDSVLVLTTKRICR